MKKQIGMGKLLVLGVASFLFLQPAFGEDPVKWELIGPAGLGGCHYSLSIDPTDDNVLYYSPDVGGLYRTMDGGKSWESMSCVFEAGGRTTVHTTVAPSNPKVVYTFIKWEARGESWRLSRSEDRLETVAPIGPVGVTGPIAIDPTDENIIYVGMNKTDVYAGQIFKSIDGGKTWTNSFMGCSSAEEAKKKDIRLGTGSPGSGSIVIDPGSPKAARILYVSGTMGVYKSSDGGNTWQEANAGLPHKHADRLAFNYDQKTGKKTIYVSLLTIKEKKEVKYAGGIYKSTDEGKSWQDASGGLSPDYFFPAKGELTVPLVANNQNPDMAYYGTYNTNGLLKTKDGGKSWEKVTFTGLLEYGGPPEKKNMEWKGEIWNWVGRQNTVNHGLVISQQNPDIVYYCDYHSMFKTTDGGKTWKQCYTNKLGENRWQTRGAQSDYIFSILPSPYHKDRLYVAEQESALFCSFDGGKSFLNACLTLPDPSPGHFHDRLSARAVAIAPDNPDIVYATGGLRYAGNLGGKLRSVIISRDGGKTWNRAGGAYDETPGLKSTGTSVLPLRNKKVLLTSPPRGLFMSKDEGESWEQIDFGWDPKGSFTFVRLYGSTLNSKRVYASTRVWSYETTSYCVAHGEKTQKRLDKKVYGIYISEDEGKTWQPLSEDLEKVSITHIAFSPDEKMLYATAATWDEGVKEEAGKISHNTGGLYKSEDGGKTWKRILSGEAINVALNPRNSDIIYLVSDGVKNDETGWKGNGIIRSIDGGKTWECIDGKKINPALQCVAINPYDTSIIYVGTRGSGAWKGIDGYVKETLEKKEGGKGIEKKGGGILKWFKNILR